MLNVWINRKIKAVAIISGVGNGVDKPFESGWDINTNHTVNIFNNEWVCNPQELSTPCG